MDVKQTITNYCIKHHKLVTIIMLALTLVLGVLIPLIEVDTDPENMLNEIVAVEPSYLKALR